MSEQVNILGQKAAELILMNAIGILGDRNPDVLNDTRIIGAKEHHVTVTINGVEVPFTEAFNESIANFMKEQDQHAYDKALEMLHRTGLREMVENMWAVREKFVDDLKALGYKVEMRSRDWD